MSAVCPAYSRRCSSWLEGEYTHHRFLATTYSALNSFSIDALKSWTQSCSTICAQKISRLNYTPFHVSTPLLVPLSFSYLSRCSAILTLCACTPPLDQVLQLWDFLLAFGVHLNVLCVIAQLLLIRDNVMASSSYVILPCTLPPHFILSFPDLCVFYAPFRRWKRSLSSASLSPLSAISQPIYMTS
jgi:hypothetical protein